MRVTRNLRLSSKDLVEAVTRCATLIETRGDPMDRS